MLLPHPPLRHRGRVRPSFVEVAVVSALAVLASCAPRNVEPERLPTLPPVAANALRSVADFTAVTDKKARSRALFLEASRVLLHPRCANCHPDGDVPLQGMEQRPHLPPVTMRSAPSTCGTS